MSDHVLSPVRAHLAACGIILQWPHPLRVPLPQRSFWASAARGWACPARASSSGSPAPCRPSWTTHRPMSPSAPPPAPCTAPTLRSGRDQGQGIGHMFWLSSKRLSGHGPDQRSASAMNTKLSVFGGASVRTLLANPAYGRTAAFHPVSSPAARSSAAALSASRCSLPDSSKRSGSTQPSCCC